ncbi:hypothetical protein HPB48_009412 [Haemaphysalis longicornis]|uniref:Peptidase M13 N-terminal domain-containing protein n=1 Tax=Haemaphysalis longicornis TaxID=44386 RepID=A0A9J6GVR8_HAELO|nr:hypothetical protein HPB48_009412 [Haemaphysalis longicornis]
MTSSFETVTEVKKKKRSRNNQLTQSAAATNRLQQEVEVSRHVFEGQHLLKHTPLLADCGGATPDEPCSASDRTLSRKRCLRHKRSLRQEAEPASSSNTHASSEDLLRKRPKSSFRDTSTEDKTAQYAGTNDGGTKTTKDRSRSRGSFTRSVRTSQSEKEARSGRTSKNLCSDNAPHKSETATATVKKSSSLRRDPETASTINTQGEVDVENSKSGNAPRIEWSEARSLLPTSHDHKTSRHEDPQHLEGSAVAAHDREHLTVHQPVDQVALTECLLYPLAGFLLCCFMVVCALLLFPAEHLGRSRARALSSKLCVSASCRQTAMYLNNLLSWKSADTCEDFYAFVCRRWTSSYDAAGAKGYPASLDDDYATYLEYRIYTIIQDLPLQSNSALKPVSELHKECMNTRRIEERGWNPLLELMFDVSLEGFPLTPPVRSSISVWEVAAKVLRKTGSCALLGVRVTSKTSRPDSGDVLSVLPPDMITSERVDLNQAIRIYTSTIFSALKVLRKEYLPADNSFTVVKFAADLERLAEVKMWRSPPVTDMLKAPSPLLQFFVELFRGVNHPIFTGEGSQVRLLAPFVTNKILDLVRQAETHIVLNYIGVRLMIETSAFLPSADLTDFDGTFLYAKWRTNLPRWQLCVRVVEKALFPLVAVTLLTTLQKHALTAAFSNLVLDIVKAFQLGINTSPYFDAESRAALRDLLSIVQFRVFGPDCVKDKALLEQYVRGLPTVTSNASGLDSYVKSHEYTFLASLRLRSSLRWARSVFSTQCWHELYPATVYVPVLLFNLTHPQGDDLDSLQLSRAGTRLNQCIFDLLVDVAYSKAEMGESWLTERTEKRMRTADACVYAPREEVAPRFTSVRDILSAQFAYAHFRRLAWDKIVRIRLAEGRDMTDEQLFFVYLMLQSCRESEDIEKGQPRDGHNWEVALSNSEDFLDAFNCSKRSSTSTQKCVL